MDLDSLLRLNRLIRVIGFDDAPFLRHTGGRVAIAGVVCAGTRFEGMVWGRMLIRQFNYTMPKCSEVLNCSLSVHF
jgi:hypothetical protein